MSRAKVAILGANAHLAKSLLSGLAAGGMRYDLTLFTRRPGPLAEFVAQHAAGLDRTCRIVEGYGEFDGMRHDVIINCVGIGTLAKHQGDYSQYFTVYEAFDNLVLSYLSKHPAATYVSFGSGAVYGGFDRPAAEDTEARIKVNRLAPSDYYTVSRIYAEGKHRAFSQLKIVDLRVFSFFSRFYDPADGYLINQMIDAVRTGTPFVTDRTDFFRDYVHPADLLGAVVGIADHAAPINRAFDLCSTRPTTKRELIAHFADNHGMQVEYVGDLGTVSATGSKAHYYSTHVPPLPGNFTPRHSSMTAIAEEAAYILDRLSPHGSTP